MDPVVIDLDAAAAARRETAGAGPVVRWKGEDLAFPAELPAEAALRLQAGELAAGVRELLGEQAERFFAGKPSVNDLEALVEGLADAYGVTPKASPGSAG